MQTKIKKKGIAKFKSENLTIKTELPFSLILDNVRDPGIMKKIHTKIAKNPKNEKNSSKSKFTRILFKI
jgi:hypothetical protein